MSELGTSAKKALEFLATFFTDIAQLLKSVDASLAKDFLQPIQGSGCYWEGSKSIYSPAYWTPSSIHRIYAFAPIPKDIWSVPVAVFFDVFLTPRCSSEPVAVWGVWAQSDAKNTWSRIVKLINRVQPEFLTHEKETEWKSVASMGFDTFDFRAYPLVELRNAETVENVVIQPLRERMKTIRKPPPSAHEPES